jgi:hypothetical protein
MDFGPLQRFVDEEMVRAPLFADEALQAVLESLARAQREGPPAERGSAADLARALFDHRSRVLAAYVEALGAEVSAEWAREGVAPEQLQARGPRSRRMGLALVDELSVSADLAQASALEVLRSSAEHELRELATFTAALVGDMDMARDWNPLRAEAHARALWAAAQGLPQRDDLPLLFMRMAPLPWGRTLRKAYASACRRLEDAGVQPAIYRTLILPRGTRRGRMDSTLDPGTLEALRSALPSVAPVTGHMPLIGELDAAQARKPRVATPGAARLDADALDMLGRLFDTLLADRRLSAKSSLEKLQPLALRLAAREPVLLEDYGHPFWRLMDSLALQTDVLMDAPKQRQRFIATTDGLLDHLARQSEQSGELYLWALERVQALVRHGNEQRLLAHAALLSTLQAQDERLAGGELPTEPAALPASQLDTVPAALVGSDPFFGAATYSEAEASDWLARRETGRWWRLFADGAWQQLQLLWVGPQREVWLFAWASDAPNDTSALAFQHSALTRLREAGVAHERKPRSLVRDAAEYLLRKAQAKQRS